jgi:N-acylethanolamine-hydrolysing acid amidase
LIDLFEATYWIWYYTNNEKWQEIEGIVAAVDQKEMTMAKCILINALYEIESWCTSIIVKQSDGSIIHARNLDFDNPAGMRKVTYRVTFTKDGEYAYDAVMFAGNCGVYTGIKAGAYSISENQRAPNDDPKQLLENMFMMFYGVQEISWLIRKTLENCPDYDCAYKNLANQEINALGYIILAGVKENEGVVISRNRNGPAHEEHINATQWYLVQTNNDHWEDAGCFNRCASAHSNLDALGQDATNIDSLRSSVLLQFPNLNYDTLYNTQFVPSTGYTNTISTIYSGDEWKSHTPTVTSEKTFSATRDLKGLTHFELF